MKAMATAKEKILSTVQIAENCPANWDWMSGDDKARYCHKCKLNVFNLSAMTESEAERLLQSNRDGKLCVRFFRRRDGKIMTKDCSLGRRLIDYTDLYLLGTYKILSACFVFVIAICLGKMALAAAAVQLEQALSQAFSELTRQANQGNRVVPPYCKQPDER
jgi:hypothetical protein